MRKTTRLRRLMEAPEILRMPGIHDALSAKLAEEAGFAAVALGGFPATGTLLAEPDSSQLSLAELAEHLARICDATSLPVFADADTGFGNVTNTARTVRTLERAGVAGLFIEDQVFPKRCGHTPGKAVVPAAEMAAKIAAACDARHDPDLLIMARTDAIAVNGLHDAIARANLYREAGADALFVEAPATLDDMRRIVAEAPGLHMTNMVDFGMSPALTGAEAQAMGFACIVWPVTTILAQVKMLRDLFARLKDADGTAGLADMLAPFDDYTRLVGLPRLREREQAFLDHAAALADAGQPPAGRMARGVFAVR